MLCPQCKTEISDDSLKCPICGARVGRLCPNCKTHNLLTAHQCKKCNYVLLKICPNCGAANTSKATECRRCGADISKKIAEHSQPNNKPKNSIIDAVPKYEAVYYSQQKAKDKLKECVTNPDIKVVSITGESGAGKNLVVKFASGELKEENYVWLTGKCSKHTKLTPCGYIQDVLLTLFNLNCFCIDINNLKKESVNFFKQDFPNMTTTEVYDFVNFLYPECYGEFKTIHSNKQNTFNLLTKMFKTITQTTDVVLVIDNFGDIDAMSLDFVKKMLSDPEINNSLTVILTHTEPRSAVAYGQPQG